MNEIESKNTLPTKIGKAMKAVLKRNRLKAASTNINEILGRNLKLQLIRTLLQCIKSSLYQLITSYLFGLYYLLQHSEIYVK